MPVHEIVTQFIHIMVPPFPNEHERLAMKVLYGEKVLSRQGMMQGKGTAKGGPFKFKTLASPQAQHRFVKIPATTSILRPK